MSTFFSFCLFYKWFHMVNCISACSPDGNTLVYGLWALRPPLFVLVSPVQLGHHMHVNFTCSGERKKQAAPCWSGWYSWGWDGRWGPVVGGGRWEEWWWRAGELIDPQLQVAELESSTERSETCPDYQTNCRPRHIHTQTKHTYGGSVRSSRHRISKTYSLEKIVCRVRFYLIQ